MYGAPFGNGITVTVRNPGPVVGKDSRNNDVRGPDIETVVSGVGFAPNPGEEVHTRARDAAIAVGTLYLPAGTHVDPRATVVFGGAVWQVDEPAQPFDNPLTAAKPGVVVKVRKVQG